MKNLKTDGVKIKYDGTFLVATMPNGDVIPMQIDLILKNGLNDGDHTGLTITLKTMIPNSELHIIDGACNDNVAKV